MRCHRNIICLERNSEDIFNCFSYVFDSSLTFVCFEYHLHPLTCFLLMLLLQVEAEKHQDVVVYDQSTRDVNGLATDSFLSILLGKLDSCFHSVSILTGRIWQQLGWWAEFFFHIIERQKPVSMSMQTLVKWWKKNAGYLTLLFSMPLCR